MSRWYHISSHIQIRTSRHRAGKVGTVGEAILSINRAIIRTYELIRKVLMAPGPGFEPGLEDSKSSVLPLNDPGSGEDSRLSFSLRHSTDIWPAAHPCLTLSGCLSLLRHATRVVRSWHFAVRSHTLVYVQAETETSSSQRLRQSEPGMVRAGAWAAANIAPEPPSERRQPVVAGSHPDLPAPVGTAGLADRYTGRGYGAKASRPY